MGGGDWESEEEARRVSSSPSSSSSSSSRVLFNLCCFFLILLLPFSSPYCVLQFRGPVRLCLSARLLLPGMIKLDHLRIFLLREQTFELTETLRRLLSFYYKIWHPTLGSKSILAAVLYSLRTYYTSSTAVNPGNKSERGVFLSSSFLKLSSSQKSSVMTHFACYCYRQYVCDTCFLMLDYIDNRSKIFAESLFSARLCVP